MNYVKFSYMKDITDHYRCKCGHSSMYINSG